jgi:hypothetical protein
VVEYSSLQGGMVQVSGVGCCSRPHFDAPCQTSGSHCARTLDASERPRRDSLPCRTILRMLAARTARPRHKTTYPKSMIHSIHPFPPQLPLQLQLLQPRVYVRPCPCSGPRRSSLRFSTTEEPTRHPSPIAPTARGCGVERRKFRSRVRRVGGPFLMLRREGGCVDDGADVGYRIGPGP